MEYIFSGTWKKDSSTNGPTTKLSLPYVSGTLILKKNGKYIYDWNADDVFGNEKGNYIIVDSTNGSKILKLIRPSGYFDDYVILEKSRDRLKVKSRHSYNTGDSTIYFDMVDVFRKIE